MRTTKFRAWLTESKYMIEHNIIDFNDFLHKTNLDGSINLSYCGDDILMQFTGLHDKNGKEIFEGEILYNNDRKENCVVKYDEEKAMFIVEYLESKDKFTLWESISNLYYSVGNIHETPELLK